MVRPHSINLLFYFSGSPHSPFLHLFLSRFMKGRGGGNPCRAPLLLPRLAASSPQQSLLSPLPLASSYSLSHPSSLPLGRGRGRSAGSTIHSEQCAAARSPLVYPPSFSMSPCLSSVCLSRLSLSFVYFVVIRGREGGAPSPDLVSVYPLIYLNASQIARQKWLLRDLGLMESERMKN